MIKTIRGRVHGQTIELNEALGMVEGQEVEVKVRTIPRPPHQPGDGLLRTEGALRDDAEWDDIMKEVHQARKQERRSRT
ncbi:hypothetical protein OJF2_39680 [Aquisphaera giovannonii]|uniref:Uncharacterized protein n=1 Tax=Aquisphaera giovannonii TaxID=406548 RepID=A0A5B9W471_9BACT|nr:hypothetical protein [Aquisphaera giovannonii]QEH35416.1 hypothetical protein OJF2_39680 [Aquisphaera giovannonii]